MPKQMTTKTSQIYKIFCKDENIQDIYIGSSINLHKRIILHKYHTNNSTSKSYNFKVYKFIRDNGGWDNWCVEIIETIIIENKKQSLIREKEIIIELQPTLNTIKPIETAEEHKLRRHQYYLDNKEMFQEHSKKFREENREYDLQRKRDWYKNKKNIVNNI
jgi:hypothetical protein